MDNTNNNQGFPEQNENQYHGPNPDQNQEQNPNESKEQTYSQNQYQPGVNEETGNTYWEAGTAGQNPNQAQGTSSQGMPAQSFQNYEQQMNGGAYYGQQVPQMPPKKKSRKKLVAALIIVLVLASLAITAYAFQDKIKNVLSLNTKSPKDYYAYVEKKEIDKAADKMSSEMKVYESEKDVACNVTADLSYDKATVNSLVQSNLGMTIEDLESQIGIPLDNIGFDMTFALKDSKLYDKLGISLNKTGIITMEMFLDTLKREMLFSFPELSPAYLKQALDFSNSGMDIDYSKYLSQLKSLSSDKTIDFLKRYATLVVDQIEDVELSKNEELEVNKESVKCNKLIITIDSKDLKNIASEVFKEAKDDDYILDLLPMFNVTKEQYLTALKDAENELNDTDSESKDDKIIMNVYVNDDGEILGRDFRAISADGDLGSLGMYLIKNGEKENYRFYVNDGKDAQIASITGSQTCKNDTYNGSASIDVNTDVTGTGTNLSFEVKYEDARREMKDNRLYTYGDYTISSIALMGIGLELKFDVKDNNQNVKLIVNMGSTDLVTLDMTAKYLKDYKMPAVSDSAQVFDTTDSEGYTATVDYEKFISDLSAKLGVDVQSVIDNLSSLY